MLNKKICYAVKNKDENIRALSRSGGVFTALSDLILNDGGTVYGCVLSGDFKTAYHTRAVTAEERDRMRGSKYIQSEMRDCYSQCRKDLAEGREVLFSGTPCQIDALNRFLKITRTDTSNLLTVDIICHSAASPKIWDKFLDEKAAGRKIDSVDFRDKARFGWRDHIETVTIDGNAASSSEFAGLFGNNLISNPHCHKCFYKTAHRVSDITLGDYWGIERLCRDFNDNKGVSLVIVNTEKGNNFFDMCSERLIIKEFNLSDSLQPSLEFNFDAPKFRKSFFRDADKMDFERLNKKYSKKCKKLYIRVAEQIFK